MREGGVAIMNYGYGEGDNRVTQAINDALNSPLLNNNDIHNSKKILLNFYCSEKQPVLMSEVKEINEFMEQMGDDIEVIWGVTFDDNLDEKVKVTLLATGSEMSVVPEDLREELRKKRELAKSTGKIYTEEVGSSDSSAEKAPQPKVSWGTKNVDPMAAFAEVMYGQSRPEAAKPTLSLDQFDDDDDMLRRMENEPAINRK
jgi:cell division protein FtsZ